MMQLSLLITVSDIKLIARRDIFSMLHEPINGRGALYIIFAASYMMHKKLLYFYHISYNPLNQKNFFLIAHFKYRH